jgi:SET domain-containing protein 6
VYQLKKSSFPLTYDSPLSDELISFVRLLSSQDDWERAEKKGKTPKPLVDQSVVDILKKMVAAREALYTTSFAVRQIQLHH